MARKLENHSDRCHDCRLPIAPASQSRCWGCLERCRRAARQRRGIKTVRPRRRGRPLLGSVSERRRAFEYEERWRARRSGRWAGVQTSEVPRWEQDWRLHVLKREEAQEAVGADSTALTHGRVVKRATVRRVYLLTGDVLGPEARERRAGRSARDGQEVHPGNWRFAARESLNTTALLGSNGSICRRSLADTH